MTTFISKFIAKVIGPKQGWREYKARARQLPASYRTALDALERYLNYLGPGGDGGAILADLLDLFEQSAANGTPIREVVGEDPVAFIEAFIRELLGAALESPGARTIHQRHRAHRARRGEPMTTTQVQGPAIHVQGLEKSYKELEVLRGVDFDVGAGQHLRPARLERGGQDHRRERPVHAAQGRRGDGQRQRLRCRHGGCGRAGVHQPHRTVRGRRRDPQRAGEPRAGRPAAASQGPGTDRG